MAKDNGLFGNFNEFVEMCEDIAERMDCSCKVKEYHRYGFNTVSLETDAFGGTFVCFNYDLKTGEIVAWKGEKDETSINSIDDVMPCVEKFYNKLGAPRKTKHFMQDLSDFLKSQY